MWLVSNKFSFLHLLLNSSLCQVFFFLLVHEMSFLLWILSFLLFIFFSNLKQDKVCMNNLQPYISHPLLALVLIFQWSITMCWDHTTLHSSHSLSVLSFPSSPSPLASIVLSTACTSKKALKSIKNVIKNAICPFKKPHTKSMSSKTSMAGSDNGILFISLWYDVYQLTHLLV